MIILNDYDLNVFPLFWVREKYLCVGVCRCIHVCMFMMYTCFTGR